MPNLQICVSVVTKSKLYNHLEKMSKMYSVTIVFHFHSTTSAQHNKPQGTLNATKLMIQK